MIIRNCLITISYKDYNLIKYLLSAFPIFTVFEARTIKHFNWIIVIVVTVRDEYGVTFSIYCIVCQPCTGQISERIALLKQFFSMVYYLSLTFRRV